MARRTAEEEPPVAERLQFLPFESPYSGVREAIGRIRRGMSDLEKYLGAVERDVEAYERELSAARASHEAHRTTVAAPDQEAGQAVTRAPVRAQRPSGSGKDWRNRD